MTAFLIAGIVAGLNAATALADTVVAGRWAGLHAPDTFAIMRHAIAPGFGDPDGFRVDDCATQRNLSEEGRAQARRIGERFREHAIVAAQVVSSAWCRCLDTAAEILPALNSFFDFPQRRTGQTEELRDWLTQWASGRAGESGNMPLILVTHQVNISALVGQSTRSGEVLFVRRTGPASFEVIGSFLAAVR